MKQVTGLSRRHFVKSSTAVAGLSVMGVPAFLGAVLLVLPKDRHPAVSGSPA